MADPRKPRRQAAPRDRYAKAKRQYSQAAEAYLRGQATPAQVDAALERLREAEGSTTRQHRRPDDHRGRR